MRCIEGNINMNDRQTLDDKCRVLEDEIRKKNETIDALK